MEEQKNNIPESQEPNEVKEKTPYAKNSIPKIAIIIGVVAIAVVVAVVLIIMLGGKHEHKWSEWQSSKVATCTQDGINIRVCDDCGENQSIPVSATGHTWSAWKTTKEVSCTQDGLKERTCSCGETETQTISASGHTFSAWNTTKEATCTVNGLKERTCYCGEKETETIIASHTWKDATCIEAKNCSKCGLTDGSALGHTCSIGTCTRCSATIYPTVNLPSTPLTVWFYDKCSMKITELSYEFDSSGNLIISFSGEKTYGENGSEIALRYKVLDEDGYVLYTDMWAKSGYNTGDKFKNITLKVSSSNLNGTSEYTIVISGYN